MGTNEVHSARVALRCYRIADLVRYWWKLKPYTILFYKTARKEALLEQDLAQLEQDHRSTAASQTLGQMHAKLLEYQDTALTDVQHLGKYATARMYGEGERPSSVLANLIRPNRE
ncbi:hypothetical protein NDU88_003146 [Pleurodeles waltl]|uniref:Uncharacterized protein n=1 Tax=Pleurodeles waltl TaxID=8319 RepID=A0AAV7L5A3_PLEWA|nr:hypothetical protein NDU88_003146 [Pleurodeles waltl]